MKDLTMKMQSVTKARFRSMGRLLTMVSCLILLDVVMEGAAFAQDSTSEIESSAETAVVADQALPELKTLDGHFPFEVPPTLDDWEQRARRLRTRVAMATGLHPMLPRGPVDATIHSPVDRDGFQIEKVYFESIPGHFVTGLLFRPTGENLAKGLNEDGKRPAVLCPHGHGGRMMRNDSDTMNRLIESGDEMHLESGSMPKIARCATLARMGCVSFIFDMVGYADSVQLSHSFANRRHETREEEVVAAGTEPELFFSTAADARLQSIYGLQTYNALRSFDFLASMEDIDLNRLAVTGGSGGGTQTIMLGALEPRVAVSFPNGMVSTSMQGGCACENACLLRIDTGNVELAALMAPKPMGMTAADDWTVDMMHDGYPELRQLYTMLGEPENVLCESLVQFKHNYNYVTRRIMYGWMNEHLRLGLETPIVETDFPALTEEEGAVWNEQHPAPDVRGPDHEQQVLSWWTEQNEKALADGLGEKATLKGFDQNVRPALSILFDWSMSTSSDVSLQLNDPMQHGSGVYWSNGKVVDSTRRREIPIRRWTTGEQGKRNSDEATVLWIQSAEFDPEASVSPEGSAELQSLLQTHGSVVVIDIGAMPTDAAEGKQRINPQPRRASAAFTFGYNRPLVVTRCADVLAVIAAFQQSPGNVTLVAPEGTAAYALPAAALAGPFVDEANVELAGFQFANLFHQDHEHFIPGIVKYGDVDALAAWRAPYALTLSSSVQSDGKSHWPTATAIYKAREAADQLRIQAK